MRSFRLLATALVLTAPLLAAAPAAACSVVSGYRAPTNLELVEQADTIVIAEVLRPDDPNAGDTRDMPPSMRMFLLVRPTLLIKGAALPGEMRIFGSIAEGDYAGAVGDPDELEAAHPLSYIGGCTRYIFPRGGTILLFLARDEHGALVPLNPPFSRYAEDVASPDARWVRAVRLYAEIAALPARERRAALVARRDALRAEASDRDALAIADDIDRSLRGDRR
ncbi:MAG TPA: hypothetical protein VLK25_07035 [Allosphingosinicella sp.]|nr:hypothetical protein [Allosphingosinicella sp.]